ncbi:BgTH12-05452 [Blumeria graminis f. sp. triticale]|uniref:BgTH12-05452 n=1 Tax=Blumeria graminis f. sp. triticale TaxID=1689686 RepID=A0A9W4D208_BLUGR|nr:BgTH12-05452 [Blumeria graminis f. sp. triticale]
MDQLSELYENTSLKPLDSLLAQFRVEFDPENNPMDGKCISQCSKLLADFQAINNLILDLRVYTRNLQNNAAIVKLQNKLVFLMHYIALQRVCVSDFGDVIESINSHASDRVIWSNVIEVADLCYEDEVRSRQGYC